MRILAVLRGLPGSGKSSWVENNDLTEFTLCPDDYRIKYGSIAYNSNGKPIITNKYDKRVWTNMMSDLEFKMVYGQFIIVDATHTQEHYFKDYQKLCDKYRYRMVIVDFDSSDLSLLKERNANRLPSYKIVPEEVIDRMAEQLKNKLPEKYQKCVVSPDNFIDKFKNIELVNLSEYKQVVVFGDIHGCYEPIKKYFKVDDSQGICIRDDTFYIFLGDYIDRGIQNKEVIDFLYSIKDLPNVKLLMGNHELYIEKYMQENNDISAISYAHETVKTLNSLDEEAKKKLREVVRKCSICFQFSFHGKIFQTTHAATPVWVDNFSCAAQNIIKGFGKDVYIESRICDETFSKGSRCSSIEFYSIHGHSNIEGEPVNNTEFTFNLNSKVGPEFGGDVRILVIGE